MVHLKKASCLILLMLVICTVFNFKTIMKITVLRNSKTPNYRRTASVIPECNAKTNVVFLKTHKTGGTTVMNIVQRFGFNRNLTFVLPHIGLVYIGSRGRGLSPWTILPKPANKQFNILCNHVTYDKLSFQRIMPNNTIYITILRHPLQRFLSAFWYYWLVYPREYLQAVTGPDKLHTFLAHPYLYERQPEYTHNSMSLDLGLSAIDFNYTRQILRHIKELDKELSLVLILEHFAESLVLLKRQLCWSIKDILFIPKNTRSTFSNTDYKNNPREISEEDMERHRAWDKADFYLYSHFNSKFLRIVHSQGEGFKDEVKHFQHVREMVSKFCTNPRKGREDSVLKIKESQFNSPFVVTEKDCDLMLIKHEEHFTRLLIEKQYPNQPTKPSPLKYESPHV